MQSEISDEEFETLFKEYPAYFKDTFAILTKYKKIEEEYSKKKVWDLFIHGMVRMELKRKLLKMNNIQIKLGDYFWEI